MGIGLAGFLVWRRRRVFIVSLRRACPLRVYPAGAKDLGLDPQTPSPRPLPPCAAGEEDPGLSGSHRSHSPAGQAGRGLFVLSLGFSGRRSHSPVRQADGGLVLQGGANRASQRSYSPAGQAGRGLLHLSVDLSGRRSHSPVRQADGGLLRWRGRGWPQISFNPGASAPGFFPFLQPGRTGSLLLT